MYYVLEPKGSEHEFIWFTDGPDDDGNQWRTGEQLKATPPVIELAAENEDALPLSDMALSNFRLHIHSPKLRATLQALGVTNIEYVSVRLLDKTSGVRRDDYRLANYLGRIACLDFKHAVVLKGRRVPIIGVEEFALLEDRIVPLPGMNTPPRIFRLAEDDTLVIAHESVKLACEREGITGVKFTPTVEYV